MNGIDVSRLRVNLGGYTYTTQKGSFVFIFPSLAFASTSLHSSA